jgi:ubiquinone/menaquinone biosynthesis C-methylase UbiE
VQPRMLAGLKKRVRKAGLSERLDARLVTSDSLELSNVDLKVDLIFAFAVVHEMPSSRQFFTEVATVSKRGARLLLVEPAGHVKTGEFEAELADAAQAGFILLERPTVRRSHAALLEKK